MTRSTGTHSKERGFTLIEVGIVAPILMVTVLGLVSTLYFALRIGATSRIEANSTYDIQEALSIMEKDVSLASQFLDMSDTNITDAYPPSSNGGKWSYLGQGSTQRALLLRSYATTSNPDSNNRQPVFVNQVGCTTDRIYYNDVVDYNTFYFILNNNLYRRRALNPSLVTCTTPYQLQSCPSLETLGTPSRNPSCQSDDELILGGVSNFSLSYYGSGDMTTPLDAYDTTTGATLVQSAAAVRVSITTNRKAMGKPTSVTSNLLMSRINVTKVGN